MPLSPLALSKVVSKLSEGSRNGINMNADSHLTVMTEYVFIIMAPVSFDDSDSIRLRLIELGF